MHRLIFVGILLAVGLVRGSMETYYTHNCVRGSNIPEPIARACILYGYAKGAQVPGLERQLNEYLHQGSGAAWASYQDTRDRYGYPPYVTKDWSG